VDSDLVNGPPKPLFRLWKTRRPHHATGEQLRPPRR